MLQKQLRRTPEESQQGRVTRIPAQSSPSLPSPSPFPPLSLQPSFPLSFFLSPHVCNSTYLDIREQLSRVAFLCSILFLGGSLLFLLLCFMFQAIVPLPQEDRDYRSTLLPLAFVWFGESELRIPGLPWKHPLSHLQLQKFLLKTPLCFIIFPFASPPSHFLSGINKRGINFPSLVSLNVFKTSKDRKILVSSNQIAYFGIHKKNTLCSNVLLCFLLAVINTTTKSGLGRNKFTELYRLQALIKGGQASSLRQKPGVRNRCRDHEGIMFTGLFSSGLFSHFLYSPHLPKGGTAHSGLNPPGSVSNQGSAHRPV